MLHVNDLSFRHGERVLFDRASAAISDGWKVGVVGRNGAGKSTLLRLIQGQLEADGGAISLTGRTRIGSVPQDPPGGTIAVRDAVLAAGIEHGDVATRRILRHRAHAHAAHAVDVATVDLELALDELQKSRFARAVAADQADLPAVADGRRGAVEQHPLAVAEGEVGNVEHGARAFSMRGCRSQILCLLSPRLTVE